MVNNLIFATSTSYPTNLGSAAAYDAKCNAVATAAGINGAGGTASYVAYTSDATSDAKTRLGSARGWVRMDGKPFADTLGGTHTVINPIQFDENGSVVPKSYTLMTGTGSAGYLAVVGLDPANCVDWSSTAASDVLYAGNAQGGPLAWLGSPFGGAGNAPCSNTYRLICMGTKRTAALPPPGTTGKLIWVSQAVIDKTPDQECQAEMPAGVLGARGLDPRSDWRTAGIVAPTTMYLRPDGTLLGSGQQILDAAPLQSGIWQFSDGSDYPMVASTTVLTGNANVCTGGSFLFVDTWWTDPSSSAALCPTSVNGYNVYCVQTQ